MGGPNSDDGTDSVVCGIYVLCDMHRDSIVYFKRIKELGHVVFVLSFFRP